MRKFSLSKRSDSEPLAPLPAPPPLPSPRQSGSLGLRRFSFKFLQPASSSTTTVTTTASASPPPALSEVGDENVEPLPVSLRSSFTHEFSRRMSLERLAEALANTLPNGLGDVLANTLPGGFGEAEETREEKEEEEETESALVGELRKIIANKDSRQQLIQSLLMHQGEYIQKIRFVSCVDDFVATSVELGRLDKAKDICRFFVESNGLFRCTGIPAKLQTRLGQGMYEEELPMVRKLFLNELADSLPVQDAMKLVSSSPPPSSQMY
ncbi:hypothetical protein BASA81_007751 [Batrachochytrium salamandrivorans]|nr:hypothetical protein BASA81_007751 [Batrachochytrium salamandrivorans]